MQRLATTDDPDAIAASLADIAVAAGAVVMECYGRDAHARLKRDQSPVCDADELAERLIVARLRAIFGRVAIIAEEAASRRAPLARGDAFLLVDALDGTREFLAHNGEFAINIALIRNGAPVAGAVYAPAMAKIWFAGRRAFACKVAPGQALPRPDAWRALRARPAPREGLVALVSRSRADAQADAFLARLPVAERRIVGASLKFCLVAEGLADVYPRFARTMEWDTAAGDAIVRAAGGVVISPDGAPFVYGKAEAGYANGPLVAWGDPAAARGAETKR